MKKHLKILLFAFLIISSAEEGEENTACESATTGEDDTACGKYTVTDQDIQICVHNEESSAGHTPCMLKTITCTEKDTGMTEVICKKLTQTDGTQACRLKSGTSQCELVDYCDGAAGTTDEECSKYALKDENKVCKKKSDDDTCEEVAKASTEDGNLINFNISLLLLLAILI